MKRTLIAAMATAASLACAVGSAGTAQADSNVGGPFHWCPGESMQYSPTATQFGRDNGPGAGYSWNMGICHTWFRLRRQIGNVPWNGSLPSDVWDGTNPPPGSVLPPLKPCVPAPLPCL
jgi:hypothetical protein